MHFLHVKLVQSLLFGSSHYGFAYLTVFLLSLVFGLLYYALNTKSAARPPSTVGKCNKPFGGCPRIVRWVNLLLLLLAPLVVSSIFVAQSQLSTCKSAISGVSTSPQIDFPSQPAGTWRTIACSPVYQVISFTVFYAGSGHPHPPAHWLASHRQSLTLRRP